MVSEVDARNAKSERVARRLPRWGYQVVPRRDVLQKLREAQALTLLGQFESAKPVLLETANRYPEFYSARRLLELIALYGEG